jgi:hypothetical protein
MDHCNCGFIHCCHTKKRIKIIETENEFGHPCSFERATCADPACQAFLGDKIIFSGSVQIENRI